MSKPKRKNGSKTPDAMVNLAAAILNLITAIILLVERLTR